MIGFLLGKFFPDYYRSVFANGMDPEFNPIAVGVGQGLTQGFVGGVVAGIVIIFIITKFKYKKEQMTGKNF